MIERSCIEIWKVQTFFCTEICKQNLAIWMFQKLSKKVFHTLRQVLLTMRVQKCGEICLTIQKVTFGLSGVSCMKCVLLSRRSEQMICKGCTKKSLKENILGYQSISVRKWQLWSSLCYKFHLVIDQHVIKYCHCLLLNL